MSTSWSSYRGGKAWAVLPDGRIICKGRANPAAGLFEVAAHHPTLGACYTYRTKGDPSTMRQLLRDFGLEIAEACSAFNLPLQLVMACIGIEATKQPRDRARFNPRCIREEPGYRSDEATPNKISPGLMQTLLSTAGDCVADCPWLNETRSSLTREDLFVPRYSVSLGAAYIRRQMSRIEEDEVGFSPEDPILNASAAYNAGSVRFDADNDWHLLTYGPTRMDEFCAWWNDSLAVIAEAD